MQVYRGNNDMCKNHTHVLTRVISTNNIVLMKCSIPVRNHNKLMTRQPGPSDPFLRCIVDVFLRRKSHDIRNSEHRPFQLMVDFPEQEALHEGFLLLPVSLPLGQGLQSNVRKESIFCCFLKVFWLTI